MPLFFKPDTARFHYPDGNTRDVDGQFYGTDPAVAFYLIERVPEAPYCFLCDNEDVFEIDSVILVNGRLEHIKHDGLPLKRTRYFTLAKTPMNFQSEDSTSSCTIFLSEEGIG